MLHMNMARRFHMYTVYLEISPNELKISPNELEISSNHLEISPIHLEISTNTVYLQISPIEFEISPIHLKISSNRPICRYLQFNWRYLQFSSKSCAGKYDMIPVG